MPATFRRLVVVAFIASACAIVGSGCSDESPESKKDAAPKRPPKVERVLPTPPLDARRVSLNFEPGIADLIRPGDHIDISATLKGANDDFIAMVAHDVVVIDTPKTLRARSGENSSASNATGQATYVLRTTDREWANIQFARANSDEDGLRFSLRPSTGGSDTKIDGSEAATLTRLVDVLTERWRA